MRIAYIYGKDLCCISYCAPWQQLPTVDLEQIRIQMIGYILMKPYLFHGTQTVKDASGIEWKLKV